MTTVPSAKMGQMELIPGATDPVPKQKNARKAKEASSSICRQTSRSPSRPRCRTSPIPIAQTHA